MRTHLRLRKGGALWLLPTAPRKAIAFVKARTVDLVLKNWVSCPRGTLIFNLVYLLSKRALQPNDLGLIFAMVYPISVENNGYKYSMDKN